MAKGILLIGDWIVDEYHFLEVHQATGSSHAGPAHFRTKSKDLEIAGAGRIARYLQGPESPRVWAVGSWHAEDEPLIAHLTHGCKVTKHGRLSLSMECDTTDHFALLRYGVRECTDVVTRRYLGTDRLLSRDDVDHRADDRDTVTRSVDALLSRLGDSGGEIGTIVVVDLERGVISSELIKSLASKYPTAQWCVRAKSYVPRWLEDVPNGRRQIVLLGPEVVGSENPFRSWILSETLPRISLKAKEVLTAEDWRDWKALFLLTDHHQVVARLDNHDVLVGAKATVPDMRDKIGWSSRVFAHLVLRGHQQWSQQADTAVSAEDVRSVVQGNLGPMVSPVKAWPSEVTAWKQAMEKQGIIGSGSKDDPYHLDVWRAKTDLPGYVACIDEKRDHIRKIGQLIAGYRENPRGAKPLSVQLSADPGAGKSSLVRALADSFGLFAIEENITQMINRENVLDLFDLVVTAQAKTGRDVIVFVDEINARIAGNPVYGAFLAPLEDNNYVRGGKRFTLLPCVWVFAGTGEPEHPHMTRVDKYDDFMDRMTYRADLSFKALKARGDQRRRTGVVDNEARLEQVYVGAMMIHAHFPGVNRVSRDVLQRFYDCDVDKGPLRQIRRHVASLRNIKDGTVTMANWPESDASEPDVLVELRF